VTDLGTRSSRIGQQLAQPASGQEVVTFSTIVDVLDVRAVTEPIRWISSRHPAA
jgi:hypothetical protein